MPSTIGFIREYLYPRTSGIQVRDLDYRRGEEVLPARLFQPARGSRRRRPAWILLHGLTCHGRAHPSLDRFARALAGTGTSVIVPEVPEWSRLQVAPAATGPAITGALDALHDLPGTDLDRVGVFGFSFGATQSVVALSDPRLGERVRALVAWGGYADLYRLFHFGITGEHELDGVTDQIVPDPYGAWVMGSNYLAHSPEYAGLHELAGALHHLAIISSRTGLHSGDSHYLTLKREVRDTIPGEQLDLFRIFVPLPGDPPIDPDLRATLIDELSRAALRVDPLLDPQPLIPGLRVRTAITHGRSDTLVPYTESVRLSRLLPPETGAACTITSLFAHSTGSSTTLDLLSQVRETINFCRMLNQIVNLV